VLLGARWAVAVLTVAALSYAGLFLGHAPLPALDQDLGDSVHAAFVSRLRLRGLYVAFIVSSAVVVSFVTRVKAELSRRERDLIDERNRQASSEKIEALVTLAAGAAHELATPLSTIAVVAGELESELVERHGQDDEVLEDLRLLRREVVRCRDILDQMAGRAGETAGEGFERCTVGELLERVIEPLHERGRLYLACPSGVAERPLRAPIRALKRALRGLVKNALEASEPYGKVSVVVSERNGFLGFDITDSGPGMDQDVLARAGNPFFTTKAPGQGMGLGLYLTRSVIERLGGSLEIESELGRGTKAQVRLPLPSDGETIPAMEENHDGRQ
ncbi:MAG: HAMP domain-containing histidine kinase, partial [Planctomycetes bacterium]|nr:HAMP domain-containing histidine kinase [Planctomycetota bacterium]